jgi:dynein heavy chain, axonemal
MGPPGGGRNPMTARLLRHFNVIAFTDMSDLSTARIFETILNAHADRYFAEPIQAIVPKMVQATISIYNTLRTQLLPTPSKSHYTFNLRDMAKVFQGVMRGDPATTPTPDRVLALWLHEVTRVFGDRLTCDDDSSHIRNEQERLLQELFHFSYKDIATADRLIFGDYLVPSTSPITVACPILHSTQHAMYTHCTWTRLVGHHGLHTLL